ncbi:MAG: IgGFc-binding protein [Deltaproteobacteria bacterium]|nr:IgGFc-binding protein [Deltaproteobacteria bacterium]
MSAAVALAASCSSATSSKFRGAQTSSGGTGGSGGVATQTDGTTFSGLNVGGSGGSGGPCEQPCSSDFHSVLDCNGSVVETCTGVEGCDPATATCKNACQAAIDNKLSVGCEYYATLMDAYAGNCFAAFIANTWNTPAHIDVSFGSQVINTGLFGYTTSGSGPTLQYKVYDPAAGVPPGEVVILFLAGEQGTPGSGAAFCPVPAAVPTTAARIAGTAVGKSFHITSDVPVVAYQINPYGGGSAAVTGASLLLPTSAWGTNYVAVNAYEANDVANPTMTIVASQDATKVTLLPVNPVQGGGGLPSGPANQPIEFMLNKGQQAQLSQGTYLTGSVLQSDKPVGFMAGHVCAFIPKGVFYCDHSEQMVPPVPALGSEYVGVMHRPRGGEPAVWRIIGAVDGTQLTWDPPVGGPATLNRGQVVEFITGTPFVVKSQDKDHPMILFQHMSGSGWDKIQGVTDHGDSDTVIGVPVEQYLREYVFFTDPTYPETNLVVVRRPDKNGNFQDVVLDCAGKLVGWQKVGAYEWTRVDLITGNFQNVGGCSTGRRQMKSTAPFGLWVWGWGTDQTTQFTANVSYGYPGGMNATPINDVVIIPEPK